MKRIFLVEDDLSLINGLSFDVPKGKVTLSTYMPFGIYIRFIWLYCWLCSWSIYAPLKRIGKMATTDNINQL